MRTKMLKFLLMVSLLNVVLVGCEKKDNRTINQIYINQFAYDAYLFEVYKVDLENKEFSVHHADVFISFTIPVQGRDYTLVKSLADDKIEEFRKEARNLSFTSWKESYENDKILDGGAWEITIVLSNGDIVLTTGFNAFPKNWDAMKEAFKLLLEEDILWSSYK